MTEFELIKISLIVSSPEEAGYCFLPFDYKKQPIVRQLDDLIIKNRRYTSIIYHKRFGFKYRSHAELLTCAIEQGDFKL